MQNILFRANSSSTLGVGHIMRDLVLASQFKDARVIFATEELPGNINEKIQEQNYLIEILNSNNLEELVLLIKKHSIDTVVIDHYAIDYDFEKALKRATGVIIFALDDTYQKHYSDILLNHNVYADSDKYIDLVPKNSEVRCGSKYTLLRNEFIKEKKKGRQFPNDVNKKNVFISIGGTDHSNLNIKILEVLKETPNIFVNLVTTSSNKHLKELKYYVKKQNNITLHIDSNSIAKLMNKAHFAIVTPSVTLNEILYLGIPFVAIQTAENQKYMYSYIKKLNLKILNFFNEDDFKSSLKSF